METDIIPLGTAKTLSGLMRARIERTPHKVAYHHYDRPSGNWLKLTWEDIGKEIGRWQAALEQENLDRGDRIAIMSKNCPEWVYVDQATLGLGLVIVPLYVNDRAENVSYILDNAGVKVLVIEGKEQWQQLAPVAHQFKNVQRIISLSPIENIDDKRLVNAQDWLPAETAPIQAKDADAHELATIVYTSGTTGNPKGVMLSHHNILWNAHTALRIIDVFPQDLMLSFLPLSHMFERTTGYYLAIFAGNETAFARSVPELPDDLLYHKPTILISVPRIFERVFTKIQNQIESKPPLAQKLFRQAIAVGWQRFEHSQGRAPWSASFLMWPVLNKLVAQKVMDRLGGRMRLAICGGAPLSIDVAQLFIGLGLTILQGYGMTESSPVISANRIEDNDPRSIGKPVPDVEIRIGENDELIARSPGVMLGYWKNEKASKETVDKEGWLKTGDKAKVVDGRIFITGRIKEIIVMANGEKVPPADMEMAIVADTLFEQVMVIGEGKPYLSLLAVLNPDEWNKFAADLGVDPDNAQSLQDTKVCNALLKRVAESTKNFPGYAQIRRIAAHLDPWTVENGLITPTLKLKRNRIMEYHKDETTSLYEGH